MNQDLKRIALIFAAVCLFLFAAFLAAYPAISNYYNEKYQSELRTEFEEEVQAIDHTALEQCRKEAMAYNATLSPVQFDREGIEAAEVNYPNLLRPSGSDIMGYVAIPKIDVDLPIYHGTSEEVLQKGVGHLIGSSLPVGGEDTHAILTGHSGVAEKKLFSDLDQLVIGDVFYLKVLNETLAYEVDEIDTVLPYETDLLNLVPDKDLCTLITCTPFGVNSHRLLVRGKRIPYEPEAVPDQVTEPTPTQTVRSTWQGQYMLGLMLGGGLAGAAIAGFSAVYLRRRRRSGHEKS